MHVQWNPYIADTIGGLAVAEWFYKYNIIRLKSGPERVAIDRSSGWPLSVFSTVLLLCMAIQTIKVHGSKLNRNGTSSIHSTKISHLLMGL